MIGLIIYILLGVLSALAFGFRGLIDIALWPVTDILLIWRRIKDDTENRE